MRPTTYSTLLTMAHLAFPGSSDTAVRIPLPASLVHGLGLRPMDLCIAEKHPKHSPHYHTVIVYRASWKTSSVVTATFSSGSEAGPRPIAFNSRSKAGVKGGPT